jgi:hypothetical protein
MVSGRTVAWRGAEAVKGYVNGDVKASFTFFASVLADGTKLPLILMAKQKIDQSHQQLRPHPANSPNSPTGSYHTQLIICHLDRLRAHVNAPFIVLILNQFSAHDACELYARAEELQIEFAFVPRIRTGTYQPLDSRVVGVLQSKRGDN